jgi:hypothetical protein
MGNQLSWFCTGTMTDRAPLPQVPGPFHVDCTLTQPQVPQPSPPILNATTACLKVTPFNPGDPNGPSACTSYQASWTQPLANIPAEASWTITTLTGITGCSLVVNQLSGTGPATLAFTFGCPDFGIAGTRTADALYNLQVMSGGNNVFWFCTGTMTDRAPLVSSPER